MRTLSLLLGLAVLNLAPTDSTAQAPSADYQIAAAELALPPALRAGATVMGHVGDAEGDLVELRAGDNGVVCDVGRDGDPADRRLQVWCGPKSARPFINRIMALYESGADPDETIRAEVEAGRLDSPTGAVTYAFRGADASYGADLVTVEAEGRQWQLVLTPFATADDLGLPSQPQGSMPWVMAEGRAFSHIMVYGHPDGDAGDPLAEITLPLSTVSDRARRHFRAGLHAFDMGRVDDANDRFARAVAADEGFALAHLYHGLTSPSTAGDRASIERAAAVVAGVSPEEQRLVEIGMKRLSFDIVGQQAAAQALVEAAPESPRAWLLLARIQGWMNDHDASRTSYSRALELAPEMASAHLQTASAFIHGEPRDTEAAIRHMQRAVELVPYEAGAHVGLGDAYRAAGDLERARKAYAEASRYRGLNGRPFVKLGHVQSFLGDYEAARASYDRARAIDRASGVTDNASLYRALVSVHAGEPEAAITELKRRAAEVDATDEPEPLGFKITMHYAAIRIALHHGMADEAESLLRALRPLANEQAGGMGTEEAQRRTDAWMAYFEARIALERGDRAAAQDHAEVIAERVSSLTAPRRMEDTHEIRGRIALAQGKAAEAAGHLRQANPDDMEVKGLLAEALEAAGQREEALALYDVIATYNFNSVDYALVRRDALEKIGRNM